MTLDKALEVAEMWKRMLEPHCERIEIAGSVRRKKPEVKDIELVCIPKEVGGSDLFGGEYKYRSDAFVDVFNAAVSHNLIQVLKGHPREGKYVQIFVEGYNIKIDIFIASKTNWGFIYAIRTGSGDYSHKVLGYAWTQHGYHGQDGHLYRGNRRIDVPEEEDLFRLIKVPFIEPQLREV
jgi:DNA polymerase/3'-5' exonuclease PolX